MNVRDIVRKAWQVTQVHLKKLIWWSAIPAFFSTIVSSAYIYYQYNALKHSFALTGEFNYVSEIKTIISLIMSHPVFSVLFIISTIIILISYFIIPPIFKAILIKSLSHIRNYESTSGSVEIGIRKFFPMFEFTLLSGSFSIITILSESLFVLRWWGQSVLLIALPIFFFLSIVGFILTFLFTYAEYFIVLNDTNLMIGIKESIVIVIANLRKTILIFILMLLIGVRIILNIVLVLFVPLLLMFLLSYVAFELLQTIGIFVVAIISFIVLLLASYLMGLFNIFATAVWVFTYTELTHNKITEVKLESNE